MQSYKEDKIISTDMGDVDELTNKLKELDQQIDHATIGKFPMKGDIVKINGLQYKVKTANAIEGTFKVKILKPKLEE